MKDYAITLGLVVLGVVVAMIIINKVAPIKALTNSLDDSLELDS